MKQSLLNDQSSMEFIIGSSARSKSQIFNDVSQIAQIQLFDISQDYDSLFENDLPYYICSKDIKMFKAEPKKNCFSKILSKIPVFHPESLGLLLWQLIVVIIIFTYLFYIPFKIAFTNKIDGLNPNDTEGVKSYLIFSIFMLGCDLLISFNSGIKKQGVVTFNRKEIAKKYMIWEFELDLIGVLSLILSLLLSDDFIRILFYLRSYYIIRFSKKIDHSLQLRSNWKAVYIVLKQIIVVLFVNHLMACFFFGVSYNEYQRDQEGILNISTWIQYNGFMENGQTIQSLSDWSRYVISFYWATTTVSTVGYGDITPKNNHEIGIALITMIIAGMIFAFNIATIREVIVQLNSQDIKYNNYEAIINRYMQVKNISTSTKTRILDYCQYVWQDEKNRNKPTEQLLISKLHPDLRQQLQYETYINFVRCKIFWNLDFSEKFIRSLVQHIQEENYGSAENIHFDVLNPHLLFLQKGEILIYVDTVHNSTNFRSTIDLIKTGQCLGQMAFFIQQQRFPFKAETLQCCNIYKLAKTDFLNEIINFPQDFEIYHSLISKQFIDLSLLLNQLDLKCFICQSDNHLADQCDVTHYYPKDILSLIKNNDDIQVRKQFYRKKQKQFNSVFISKQVQLSTFQYNNKVQQLNQISMKQQIQFEEIIEEENLEQQYQNDIKVIKSMLNSIMNKIGINQKQKNQNNIDVFIPQKPKFDFQETSFDIDLIKNYEYFYPQYNLEKIIKRLC